MKKFLSIILALTISLSVGIVTVAATDKISVDAYVFHARI